MSDPIHFAEGHESGYRALCSKAVNTFLSQLFAFGLCFIGIRAYEYVSMGLGKGLPPRSLMLELSGLPGDIIAVFTVGLLFVVPFIILFLVSEKSGSVLFLFLFSLLLLIKLSLVNYFFQSLIPLGADFWGYTLPEIRHTVSAAGGVPVSAILAYILFISGFLLLYRFVFRDKSYRPAFRVLLLILFPAALLAYPFTKPRAEAYKTDMEYFLVLEKLSYFTDKSLAYYQDAEQRELDKSLSQEDSYYMESKSASDSSSGYVRDPAYPFIHKAGSEDVLGPYFTPASDKPDIVIIIIESMGRAYSGQNAYLGSFTPFLDSLSQHSLHWDNFLSTGGRTFAVLPSLLGSLPFAAKGFLEMGRKAPDFISLPSILNSNGYASGFYYGGEASFDQMDLFLQREHVSIHDMKSFGPGYKKVSGSSGFSWGFSDMDLFRHYFEVRGQDKTPRLDVLLTVSNHSPFVVPNQELYSRKVEEKMASLHLDAAQLEDHKHYLAQYSCILYTDDAIRRFFAEYKTRPSFGNTIFIITGDHRMPEIPVGTKIDRFHVPLIVYSPRLKGPKTFRGVCSQFDLTPTLLSFLSHNHALKTPELVPWVGTLLDNSEAFRSLRSIPLMRNKNEMLDYLDKDYFLAEEQVFRLHDKMDIEPENNEAKKTELKAKYETFKANNNKACFENRLIPDSLKKYN